jgi:hypothetical protein
VLATWTSPKRTASSCTPPNPLERLNGEIKRRTDVVGIFPNDDASLRPVGATLLEQNDEWTVLHARYMALESIAPLNDDSILSGCPPWPPERTGQTRRRARYHCRSCNMSRDTISKRVAPVTTPSL